MDRTEVLGSFRILRQQDLWQRQNTACHIVNSVSFCKFSVGQKQSFCRQFRALIS